MEAAMDDRAIVDCIRGLAADERHLRDLQRVHGSLGAAESARLADVTAGLEHMWHLLRTRRGGLAEHLVADPGEERLSA
jgi:uncharacterized protein DUF2630